MVCRVGKRRLVTLSQGVGAVSYDLRSSIAANTWSPNGTYANCYDCTVTLPGDVKMLGNVWSDDGMMVQVASEAAAGATLNRAYMSDWTAGTATLTIHVADDPRTSGKVYRYSSQLYAVSIEDDGAVVRNVSAIGNGHQDGAVRLGGENARVTGGTIRDMPRHGMLVGIGAIVDGVTFIRGRNDREGSTTNALVCNQPTITGGTLTVRNCRFDGSDGAGLTGPYAHGSTVQLLAAATFSNNIYRTMALMHDACAVDMQIIGADAQGITEAVISSRAGAVTTMTGTVAGSTISRILNMTAQGDFASIDNTVAVPSIAEGFYRSSVSSADCDLDIDGDTITVQAEAAVGSPSHVIYWVRGNVSIQNTTIGPAVGAPLDALMRVGVGQTSVLVSANNVYPLGSSFQVNGTTYNTLGELQAATFDTGSTEASIPAATFSDNFNRANGNLDGSTGWTRAGGSANQMTVVGNNLAAAGTTQTLYHTGDLGSADHWARATIRGAGTIGPLLVVRAEDQNNWFGIRWSSTAFTNQACVAGSFTTGGNIPGITPEVGDEVLVVARGMVVYSYIKKSGTSFWRRFDLRDVSTFTALAANKKAGLVARNATQSPWIDDFSCGLADSA